MLLLAFERIVNHSICHL